MATTPPRWITDTKPGHSEWYIDRFRKMASDGDDLGGEARLIDAMVPRHSRILDAGCGPGRLGAHLYAAGHDVIGVDVDPKLIAAAEADHPGPTWLVGDLAELDLPARGVDGKFDAIVCAGNVMVFIAPDTEVQVLRRLAAHLADDAPLVVGFHTNRHLSLDAFDAAVADAGLRLDLRLGTWDVRPWSPESDWAVSILRLAGPPA
ncbi:SAM-dependent methyltransferase [Gordonia iterans]|uniref:SAM-dependent methyltransferase n=1 Tax=Gordonia iterans TaxID=1004901 RepID=A0A2S0KE14_9ACTN|nr:class I SAM-dependent methyltransferase [Gordonia iterans]AVL99926.1 SAM-dependent methyltransferase [Gordonia iterans]